MTDVEVTVEINEDLLNRVKGIISSTSSSDYDHAHELVVLGGIIESALERWLEEL